MQTKGISLRGLEIFVALGQSGSVAQAATELGLSQPSVSQQMRNLETAVGAALLDHSRRPMRLTPAGASFLARASAILAELRHATAEISVMDLAHLSDLSLGVIDDFDDNLTPRLAVILAEHLRNCRFRMITASSHDLVRAVRDGGLHMAISAETGETLRKVTLHPLARDPFIIVQPAGQTHAATDLIGGKADLAFLRYARDQLIAAQIETYLREVSSDLPARFQIGSHLTLMAMVARGIGWTITTPLGFMRAARFHEALSAQPLPGAGAARRISLYAGADWNGDVPRDVAVAMRQLLDRQMITPAIQMMPWIRGNLHLITA